MEDLRKLRINANMTQEQLASKANISLRQLVRIEKNECRPNLETKILIFKALNFSEEQILNYIKENYL